MGAPKKSDRTSRTKQIQTYVSKDEDELLSWASEQVGITKAAFLRMAALKEARLLE